jgi:hypothetical protein
MESFNPSKKKEQQTTQKEKNKEKEKSREYFGPNVIMEKFRKWGRIGAFVGVLFIGRGNVLAMQPSGREFSPIIAYPTYSLEETKEIDRLEKRLIPVFGKKNIQLIKEYDANAYLVKKSSKLENINKKPELVFAPDSKFNKAENFNKFLDLLDEEKNYLPRNWVNKEIGSIEFRQYNRAKDSGRNNPNLKDTVTAAAVASTSTDLFSELLIFEFESEPAYYAKSVDGKYLIDLDLYDAILTHELGHANDWMDDLNLNLKERLELLSKIADRLKSKDRFRSIPSTGTATSSSYYGGKEYYEAVNDGTKDGFFISAREYWAEIVSAYFLNPKELLEKYPKDFALVDWIVKKNDPSYDVFKRAEIKYGIKFNKKEEAKEISTQNEVSPVQEKNPNIVKVEPEKPNIIKVKPEEPKVVEVAPENPIKNVIISDFDELK